jgi:hypothetical protein
MRRVFFCVLVQAYPYLHVRNKEFPWGMDCLPLSHYDLATCIDCSHMI